MKIAISQSNYIPWKGYFDLIKNVDEFIFLMKSIYKKRLEKQEPYKNE